MGSRMSHVNLVFLWYIIPPPDHHHRPLTLDILAPSLCRIHPLPRVGPWPGLLPDPDRRCPVPRVGHPPDALLPLPPQEEVYGRVTPDPGVGTRRQISEETLAGEEAAETSAAGVRQPHHGLPVLQLWLRQLRPPWTHVICAQELKNKTTYFLISKVQQGLSVYILQSI